MSTQLSPAEQDQLKRVILGNALNGLNAPVPYDGRVEVLLPFVTVIDKEEIDPTDKRDRPDPEDKRDIPDSAKRRVPIHPSELRRIMVPRVCVVHRDGGERTEPCKVGSGAMKPYPVEKMVRDLADNGDRDGRLPQGVSLRWKLYGQAH